VVRDRAPGGDPTPAQGSPGVPLWRQTGREIAEAGRSALRNFSALAIRSWRWAAHVSPPLGRAGAFAWEVARKYYKDDCFTHAAGLSFWLIISLVPMTTLLFKLLGVILGDRAYAAATQRTLESLVPFLPKSFVLDAIDNSKQIGGMGLSWGVLLFGSYWGISWWAGCCCSWSSWPCWWAARCAGTCRSSRPRCCPTCRCCSGCWW
jgi:hypothetical protein